MGRHHEREIKKADERGRFECDRVRFISPLFKYNVVSFKT